MSRNKRRSAATATVGLAGVGGAGALRHLALEESYQEKTRAPIKRPRVAAELRMLKHPKGRAKWLAGAGLGLVSVPPAAVGTHGLFTKRESLLKEGYRGVKDSLSQRNDTLRERPPVRLAAANYLAGVGAGSAAGGLTHHSLGKTRLSGGKRSAAASIAGVLAGTATLPAQSKIIQRASHGRYEATATGVRRKKRQPAPASSKAGLHGNVAKAYNPKQLRNYRGIWTAPRRGPDKGGRLVAVRKAEDVGGGMTRGQRRTRFVASGGVPVVGDFTSAAQAARLAPPGRRRKVAAQQGAANVGSGLSGNVAGGVGAAYLAGRHKGFERKVTAANDWVDTKANRARAAVGMKPARKGPGRVSRTLQHPRLPTPIRSAAGLVASKPKVAAVGALVGGALAGTAGSQTHYGRVMTRDDRYRKANPSAAHGSRKVSKLAGKPLSQREKQQLAGRKRRNAMMLYFTGTTGLGALGATTGEKVLRTRKPKIASHLGRATVPLLTAGAGVGGLNAYTGAKIQRREAQTLSKGLRVRRVRGMRGGYLRQTRLSNGATLVSSVRGGLG